MKPDMAHLQAFGCDAYALTPIEHGDKLGKNSQKCVMLGYGKTTTHYRLWNPESKRVIIATHVEFNENEATASNIPEPDELPMEEAHDTVTNYGVTIQNNNPIAVPSSRGGIGVTPIENLQPQPQVIPEPVNEQPEDQQPEVRRSTRT